MVLLTAALLLLSACSSDTGSATTATSASQGSAGTSSMTAASAAGQEVGAPGPAGVGRVVATSDGAGTYIDITPDELAAMLRNKDFLFVNTHIPYAGEIGQTDLFIPYDQAAQQTDKLPRDKNARIVVYCRSDRMSRIAIDAWVKAGYTNLYNLDGGFEAWEAAGYELLQK